MTKNKFRLLFLLAALSLSTTMKAQNAQSFINHYRQFTDTAWVSMNPTEERCELNNSIFSDYTRRYHNTYKELMTAEQLETYTELRTRYLRQRAQRSVSGTASDVSSSASKTGRKVAKGTQKVGAKVSGFLHGLFSGKR